MQMHEIMQTMGNRAHSLSFFGSISLWNVKILKRCLFRNHNPVYHLKILLREGHPQRQPIKGKSHTSIIFSKDQKSTDDIWRQFRDLRNKIGIEIQPASTSGKTNMLLEYVTESHQLFTSNAFCTAKNVTYVMPVMSAIRADTSTNALKSTS